MPRVNKLQIRQGTGTPSAEDFATSEPAFDPASGRLWVKGSSGMVEVASVSVYETVSAFPATGRNNVLYVDSSTSRIWRWESPIYVETGPAGGGEIYTLPNATNTTLGAVIVGTGLSVSNGTISANVVSVAGRTGAVTLTSSDVSGLGSLATANSVAYSSLTGTPSTFAPSAHANSHASGGSDALTLSAGQITGLASVATSGSAADLSGALADACLSNNVVLASTLTTQLSGSSTVVDALPRIYALSNVQATNGQVLLVFFTPLQTVTISQISIATTAAGTVASGLTLCRMGLYTYTDAGTATLVARTASDTTLFAATNTVYTRSLDTTGGYPATYTLTAGVRYGAGYIGVGTTQPQVTGRVVNSVTAGLSPRLSGSSGTLSDLPASFTPSINSLAPFVRLS